MSANKWRGTAILSALAISASGCGLIGDLKKQLEDEANKERDKYADLVPNEGVEHASQTVGSDGGDITTENAGVKIPEGATNGDVQVSVAKGNVDKLAAELPALVTPAAPPVAFTPHGTQFTKAVQLALFYPPEVAIPLVLRLDDENDTSWEVVQASASHGIANVTTMHFSVYMVVSCGDGSADGEQVCMRVASGNGSIGDLDQPTDGNVAGDGDSGCGPDGCTTCVGDACGGGDGAPPDVTGTCADLGMCDQLDKLCAGDPANELCSQYGPVCEQLRANCNETSTNSPPYPGFKSCGDLDLCATWDGYCASNDDPDCGSVLDGCASLNTQCSPPTYPSFDSCTELTLCADWSDYCASYDNADCGTVLDQCGSLDSLCTNCGDLDAWCPERTKSCDVDYDVDCDADLTYCGDLGTKCVPNK